MKLKKIILYYGILWGLFEFVLGGYLLYIELPYNELILRTIGFAILIVFALKHKSPLCLMIVGMIAASFKTFNIVTCGLHVLGHGVIMPMLFILLQTSVVSLLTNKVNNKMINHEIK